MGDVPLMHVSMSTFQLVVMLQMYNVMTTSAGRTAASPFFLGVTELDSNTDAVAKGWMLRSSAAGACVHVWCAQVNL
jgi:hypothetical protein